MLRDGKKGGGSKMNAINACEEKEGGRGEKGGKGVDHE